VSSSRSLLAMSMTVMMVIAACVTPSAENPVANPATALPTTDNVPAFCQSSLVPELLASKLDVLRKTYVDLDVGIMLNKCENYRTHALINYDITLKQRDTGKMITALWIMIVHKDGIEDFPVMLSTPGGFKLFTDSGPTPSTQGTTL
jgi:hypothetical protein